MTGSDVPTRQKALSVTFSVIMVLSMVAVGMAGFAGSAAATESTANGGSASFYATDATSSTQGVSKHVVRVNISGTNVANSDFSSNSGSAGSFSIEYSDGVNLDGSRTGDDFANTGNKTVGSSFADDDSIDIYIGGDELDTSPAGGDNALVSRSGSNLTVDFSEDSLATAGHGDASDDDIITIVLRTESADDSDTVLDNPGSSTTVDLTLNDGNGNQEKFTNIGVDMDEDAPITAELNGGDEYYYTLGDAVNALGNNANTEVIDVQEDLFIRDDPANEVFNVNSAPYTIGNDDTVINGSSTVFVGGNDNVADLTYDGSSEYLLEAGGATGITIEDLTLNDTEGGLKGAIGSSGTAANNLIIDNVKFENFDGDGPVLELGTGSASSNVNVTNNFFDVGQTNVISIIGDQTDGDLTQVDNNEITYQGGSDEKAILLDFDEDDSDDDGEVTINGNEIYGESGQSQTGVSLEATGAGSGDKEFESNITIDGFYAENVTTAITDASQLDSDTIDISNFEIVDSTNGIDLVVASSGGDTTQNVNIQDTTGNGVELDGSGTGIAISEGGSSLSSGDAVEIQNVTINNTDIGISNDGLGGFFNVSDSDLTNVDNTAGIQITGAVTDSVNVDTVTVTDANPDSKNVKAVDVNAADVAANITGLTATDVDIGVDAGTANNNNQDLTVTESTFTRAGSAGVLLSTTTTNDQVVSITNNEFINGTTGLDVGEFDTTGNDEQYNVHLNTFEKNDDGVVVDSTGGTTDSQLNVTFNDFVDNGNNALDTSNGLGGTNTVVNANYSWWDNRDYSRIVGPYTLQNAGSQLPSPRRVYEYTRLHTGGQP